MKKFAIASGLLVALSMMMLGCGGDGGGSGDDVGSGVSRSKAMAEITLEEANTVCDYTLGQANLDDFQKVGCYLAAAFASGLDPSIDCEAVAQECSNEPITDQGDVCEVSPEAVTGLPACASMVTIGEYEDCQVAMFRAISEFAEDVSCSNAAGIIAIMPEECQEIQSICPELLEAPVGIEDEESP